MRYRVPVVLIAALLVAPLGGAIAAPRQGFGVALGSARYFNETSFGGIPQTYAGGGAAIAIDYQTVMGPASSLTLLYIRTLDSTLVTNELPIAQAEIGDTVVALQGRFWLSGSVFAGAHIGLYSQVLTFTAIQPEEGNGVGFGIAVGGEFEVTQHVLLTIVGHYDKAPSMDVLLGYDRTSRSGSTLLVGLRFVN